MRRGQGGQGVVERSQYKPLPRLAAGRGAALRVAADMNEGPPRPFVGGSLKMVRNGLGGEADFSYWQWYKTPGPPLAGWPPDGPIAQLDRVTDFYSVGCRFESCWDRHYFVLLLTGTGQPFRGKSVATSSG